MKLKWPLLSHLTSIISEAFCWAVAATPRPASSAWDATVVPGAVPAAEGGTGQAGSWGGQEGVYKQQAGLKPDFVQACRPAFSCYWLALVRPVLVSCARALLNTETSPEQSAPMVA